MKSRYDLVVFDWEGTLAEDAYGQVVSIIAREAENLKILNFDKVLARKYLPLGLVTIISKFFQNLTIQQQEQLLSKLQETLHNELAEVVLMKDAAVVVKKLYEAGIQLAIATNRSLNSLQKSLDASGLKQYFQIIRTASQAKPKPCPDMLEEIMWECGVSSSMTLMVGDSISDIEMAVTLGVDAVGVDFYHEQQGVFLQNGALLEIDDYQDLLKVLV